MTAPRQVVPGRSYFVTRRCTQRLFLLRPDKRVNQAIEYCLAEAAARFGITVLWMEALSNHVHFGIYDPHGVYPAFLARFHGMVAKCVNALRGRWENMWASEQSNVVELVDPPDGFGKMIYSYANPLVAHLVERALHWPGVSSLKEHIVGKSRWVRRPHWFFAKDGAMPEKVELRYGRPPGYEHLSQDAWADMVIDAIRAEEAKAAEERKRTGIPILGVKAVKAQSWNENPKTSEERRGIKPRVAAKSKWHRIEALRRNKRFLERYREAFIARTSGDLDVVFPFGTYELGRLRLVRVEPPPRPTC